MAHDIVPPPSLLLLPAPPASATRQQLHTAYGPALEAALAQTRDAARSATLVVAVVGSFLRRGPDNDAAGLLVAWPDAQALLAGLYALVAGLCEKLALGSDVDGGPGAVDARVVLVEDADTPPPENKNTTIVIDRAAFLAAAAARPWTTVFSVAGAAGQRLRDECRLGPSVRQVTVGDDESQSTASTTTTTTTTTTTPGSGQPGHRIVCLGGTFDHLHPGHKLLLTAGALLLDVPAAGSGAVATYVIGITGDALLRNKKYAAFVQPWAVRARSVLDVLGTVLDAGAAAARDTTDDTDEVVDTGTVCSRTRRFRQGTVAVECVRIDDAFGPTVEREAMDCLVVSGETRSGGQAVNDKRTAKGWAPLVVYEVDVLSSGDEEDSTTSSHETAPYASKISSTAIRKKRAEQAAA